MNKLQENKDLEDFRNQWKKELKIDVNSEIKENVKDSENIIIFEESEEEKLGRTYWEKATRLEQEGEYIRAVKYYKRAFKLAPDLELTVRKEFQLVDKKNIQKQDKSINQKQNQYSNLHIESLIKELPNNAKDSVHFLPQWAIPYFEAPCEPLFPIEINHKNNGRVNHISEVPNELISQIFSHLDPFSLEIIGRVCKIWFILSRDITLWKKQCFKLWPSQEEELMERALSAEGDWRKLFMNKPRPRMDGIYISKSPYIRRGETEGSHVQPMFQITNWWYLRFYSDGKVLCLQSVDKPKSVLSYFHTQPLSENSLIQKRKYSFVGEYSLEKNETGKEQIVIKINNNSIEKKQYFVYRMNIHSSKTGYQNRITLTSHELIRNEPYDNIEFDTSSTKLFRFIYLPNLP